MDFNENNATEAVLNSFARIEDKRLKQINLIFFPMVFPGGY